MYHTTRCIQEGNSMKTDKADKKLNHNKSAEKLEDSCHIPDLVQAFSEENSEFNLVLRCIKPPTSMTVDCGSATFTKRVSKINKE